MVGYWSGQDTAEWLVHCLYSQFCRPEIFWSWTSAWKMSAQQSGFTGTENYLWMSYLGGEMKGLPSYLMPFPMYFQMSPDIHRFSSLTAPFIPPWFLDVENHPSVWVIGSHFISWPKHSKSLCKHTQHTQTVCVHIYVHRKEVWALLPRRPTSSEMCLESVWAHLYRCRESLTPLQQALKVWGRWWCVAAGISPCF